MGLQHLEMPVPRSISVSRPFPRQALTCSPTPRPVGSWPLLHLLPPVPRPWQRAVPDLEGVLAPPGQGSEDCNPLLSAGKGQGEGLTELGRLKRGLGLPNLGVCWLLPPRAGQAVLGWAQGKGDTLRRWERLPAPLVFSQASYPTSLRGSR